MRQTLDYALDNSYSQISEHDVIHYKIKENVDIFSKLYILFLEFGT
ncbi:hypothetical protein GCM10007985_07850 [Aliarcobacter butzleri]|nr:hypothetical protein GCM10007985_07850 [Aliarcobacter butzleri]SNV29215.1 Uncharacterised protein [Aliarcobacter butzleri]